jgi:hypothetical protein
MRIAPIVLSITVLVSACGADHKLSDATPPDTPAANIATSPTPAAPVPSRTSEQDAGDQAAGNQTIVPIPFQGRYARDATACRRTGDETQLTLGADAIRFHESGGPIASVATRDGAITLVARLTGEGETREATYRFRLSDDGTALTDITQGSGLVRQRCPGPSSAAPPAAPLPRLALSSEGLDLVDAASGSTRHLRFGSDLPAVLTAIARVEGTASERATNGECGAGPLDIAMWPDGLSLLGQKDRFVGWAVNRAHNAGGPAPATMSGIGIGSTRAQLESAYVIQVQQTTLGTEFSAGALQGVLASPRPDARITALWAGTSCVFR